MKVLHKNKHSKTFAPQPTHTKSRFVEAKSNYKKGGISCDKKSNRVLETSGTEANEHGKSGRDEKS